MPYVRTCLKPPLSFPSVSGAVCSFDSQYAGIPLKSHTVDIDSVSGVSAIHIQNTCGVNQWDEVAEIGGINVTTGQNQVDNRLRSKNYIRILPNTVYGGIAGSGDYINLFYYDESKDYLYYTGLILNGRNTFTTPSNACYMRILLQGSYGTTYNNDISINYPSTDTSYHAFEGQSFDISIGSTVNEATYNARTGVLEVTQPSVQTIQLPPCPIDTLEVNNIWADTGDTTLQYIKIGG